MPETQPGQTIDTDQPLFEVAVTPQNPLPPGKLVFQLVVVDDSGNESLPATLEVNVIDSQRPTAIIRGPTQVPQGQSFTLDGRASTDIGGRIVQFRWTRMA